MRKHIVAANWKMNIENWAMAQKLLTEIEAFAKDQPSVDVYLACPMHYLGQALIWASQNNVSLKLGAQNCHEKDKGAFTGEISAPMLKSLNCQFVVLGHSERRQYFNENDQTVNAKIKQVLDHGMEVVYCLGEKLEERQASRQNEIVSQQMKEALREISEEQMAHIHLAYEPVWAIGTGETASPEMAQEMHAFLRTQLADRFNTSVADHTTILYGGSCKPSNAAQLFAMPDIDGGLIGGASLKTETFNPIIAARL